MTTKQNFSKTMAYAYQMKANDPSNTNIVNTTISLMTSKALMTPNDLTQI